MPMTYIARTDKTLDPLYRALKCHLNLAILSSP